MSAIHAFSRSKSALGAIGLGLVLSAPAIAQPDRLWPASTSAITVDGSAATVSDNFSAGADGSTTLDPVVFVNQVVNITVTWRIKNNAGGGGNTSYTGGKTVWFASSTLTKPGAEGVVLSPISNCTGITSVASTCTTALSFAAPATAGSYSVEVVPTSATGLGALQARDLVVNFSVAERPEPEVLDTTLTVAKQCTLLNAGNIDLSARLEETASNNPILGEVIDFFLDPELNSDGFPTASSISVGSGVTGGDGTATLSYNVNGLGVGDHNLYAEFDGNLGYYPSNDSDILGVSYVFGGFQQPINADGTSVFGNGRVIPVKIRLVDANGQLVTDAAPEVWLTQYSTSTGLGTVLEEATSVSSADTGNVMRYVPEDGHYIYNMDMSALVNGTYAVIVDLGDSTACSKGPYYAIITVAKKKK